MSRGHIARVARERTKNEMRTDHDNDDIPVSNMRTSQHTKTRAYIYVPEYTQTHTHAMGVATEFRRESSFRGWPNTLAATGWNACALSIRHFFRHARDFLARYRRNIAEDDEVIQPFACACGQTLYMCYGESHILCVALDMNAASLFERFLKV